ncbi:uncharacterized protein LOC129923362 isoform X2 [Biomphalaria glabrata]|uniref:Uncharacterized protein LOC129923362 isoform X2 n=1 Tax=Biomphalaria glabrata TaxID=6526 RepID=A0A9W2Z4L3_BIOGL|nr:uncharacterized protein LOC129923362 isoform X2 [Biomphalaria glabrata]XP_055869873.1 uncharacterized protein LOC129923362 isoform X2 [Biomphalaria glabrata]
MNWHMGLASKKVAEESMEKAAREVKEKVGISNEEGITDCGVSIDGTWQRRGHSSHHGVVTAISIETGDAGVINSTIQRWNKTGVLVRMFVELGIYSRHYSEELSSQRKEEMFMVKDLGSNYTYTSKAYFERVVPTYELNVQAMSNKSIPFLFYPPSSPTPESVGALHMMSIVFLHSSLVFCLD